MSSWPDYARCFLLNDDGTIDTKSYDFIKIPISHLPAIGDTFLEYPKGGITLRAFVVRERIFHPQRGIIAILIERLSDQNITGRIKMFTEAYCVGHDASSPEEFMSAPDYYRRNL